MIVGSKIPKESLLRWIGNWGVGPKVAVLIGPPGCGKTVLAREVLKEAFGELGVFELAGTGGRCMAELRETVMSKQVGFVKPRPRVVFIDDVDLKDVGQVAAFCRTSRVPVVCTAAEVPSAIARISEVIRVPKPSVDQLAKYLCSSSGGALTMQDSRRLAAASNCDIRQALIEMRVGSSSCDRGDGPLFLPRLKRTLAFFEDSNRSDAAAVVQENYTKVRDLTIHDAAVASDYISEGDVVSRTEVFPFFAVTAPCIVSGGPLGSRADPPACFRFSKTTLCDVVGQLGPSMGRADFFLGYADGLRTKYVDMYARAPPHKYQAAARCIASEFRTRGLGASEWEALCVTSKVKMPPLAKVVIMKAFQKSE